MCTFSEDCAKRVSVFCCGATMCRTCYANHFVDDGGACHNTVKLSYDKRENKLAAVCTQHAAFCTHFCSCAVNGGFFCMYCLHRDAEHKRHAKVKISEVYQLREALSNEVWIQRTCMKSSGEKTRENIVSARKLFVERVRKRRERCVQMYKDFVEREERILAEKFDRIADSHLEQYEEKCLTRWCETTVKKQDVELALLRDIIFANVNQDTCRHMLKTDDVHLSGSFNFLSQEPLGEIENVTSEESLLPTTTPPRMVYRSTFTLTNTEDMPSEANGISDGVEQCNMKYENSEGLNECVDIHQLKSQGNEFFKKNQYDRAIKCYSEAIVKCPVDNKADLAVFYQNRAAANEKLKRWEAVVRDCTHAIELDIRYCKALRRRANAYRVLKRKEDCLEDSLAACRLEGDEDKPIEELTAEIAIGRISEVAKTRKPPLPTPYRVKKNIRYFESEGVFEIPLSSDQCDMNYKRISDSLKAEDYKSVIRFCSLEISTNGKHKARALLLRGIFRYLMNDPKHALCDFQVAVVLWFGALKMQSLGMGESEENIYDTSSLDEGALQLTVDAFCRIAFMSAEGGDSKECFDKIDVAIDMDPENPKLLYHKGQCLSMLGMKDEAIDYFRSAIESDPKHVASYVQLALCTKSCKSLAEAKEILDKALLLLPESAVLWNCYGTILGVDHPDEAIEKFDKALSIDPYLFEAYFEKAMLLGKLADLDGAESLFKKAIAIDPSVESYLDLSDVQRRKDDVDGQIESLEKATQLTSDLKYLSVLFKKLVYAQVEQRVLKRYKE